jgi:hypothetical protein
MEVPGGADKRCRPARAGFHVEPGADVGAAAFIQDDLRVTGWAD